MALIVENGTGLSTANSLVAVAVADAYHLDRNHTAWEDAGGDEKEAALVKASDYLRDEVRFPWAGIKTAGYNQRQPWPRSSAVETDGTVVPTNVVPWRVADACCELALKSLAGDLLPDLDRGGRIASESVGGISTSYAADAPAGAVIQAVDGLLKPLLRCRKDARGPRWIGRDDSAYGADFALDMHRNS